MVEMALSSVSPHSSASKRKVAWAGAKGQEAPGPAAISHEKLSRRDEKTGGWCSNASLFFVIASCAVH
eukprot:scaffold11181_cov151-Isochrysis_galbana.AAC.4